MDANRVVKLHDYALNSFKEYVIKSPTEYLKHFVRPYYSYGPGKERADYYLHVGEPYYYQIFGNDFENFLLSLDKDDKLVLDILGFTKDVSS